MAFADDLINLGLPADAARVAVVVAFLENEAFDCVADLVGPRI